jgi:hypothetical protein
MAEPNGPSSVTQLILGIIAACLALALLPYVAVPGQQTPAGINVPSTVAPSDLNGRNPYSNPDTQPFLLSHTLDPTIGSILPFKRYTLDFSNEKCKHQFLCSENNLLYIYFMNSCGPRVSILDI